MIGAISSSIKSNRRVYYIAVILTILFSYTAESFGQARKARSEGFDPNEPPETRFKIAPYLTFGSQIEIEYRLDRNLDLDGSTDEDLSTIEPEINLAFSFDPFSFLQVFANFKFGGEFEIEDGRKQTDRSVFEVEEAYIFLKDLFDDTFSLQVGRQQFDDERQWLYDAELDGARAFVLTWGVVTQLSFTRGGVLNRDILRESAGDKIDNYIAYSAYYFNEDTNLAGYIVARNDRTGENDSPIFIGMHSDGEATDSLDYWLELAYVTGEEGERNLSGFGFDVGTVYAFDTFLEPSFTLGYAFGSEEFRQTGLQSNEGDFNGVFEFFYYGELFEPELSNLSILTGDVGLKPTEETSIDLVYHYYFQTKASDEIRDSNLEAEPDGVNKSLGSEIDLVLGFEQQSEKIAAGLTLGYFIPGAAFPNDAVSAFSAKLILSYEF